MYEGIPESIYFCQGLPYGFIRSNNAHHAAVLQGINAPVFNTMQKMQNIRNDSQY